MTILSTKQIRVLAALGIAFSFSLCAQQKTGTAANATPKNLKILTADPDLLDTMRGFNEALGVQCAYCHVAGDFASDSDDNPQKATTRQMIAMVRQMESEFPSTGGVLPRGYHEVDCVTCHRGDPHPASLSNKRYAAAKPATP